MKKRVLSAACAVAMLASLVPVPVYAADTDYSFSMVLDAADANGDGYVDAGEEVALTVSFEGLDWAKKENGMRLLGMTFCVDFNNEVLEAKDARASGGEGIINTSIADNVDATLGDSTVYEFYDNGAMGGAAQVNSAGQVTVVANLKTDDTEFFQTPDIPFTAEKYPMLTWHFVGKEDMPAVELDSLFEITDTDFVFGPSLTAGSDAEVPVNPSTRSDAVLKVDTLAPTVTLEGAALSGDATYYYQPLTVSAADNGSGLASITLDGAAVENGGTIAAGGTLAATDNRGNTVTYTVTVDSAAYDAAREAAAALPETITYADKAAVGAARTALNAVTDEAARSKLGEAETKVTAAESVIAAIETGISEVEELINALPATDTLTVKDTPALSEIETALAALEAQGVTSGDIDNYETYTAAKAKLEAVMAEINEVKDLIDALPVAEEVGYGDEAAVAAAEKALEDLRAKYAGDVDYIDEAVGAETLAAVRKSLDGLLAEQEALIEKIAATEYNITMFEKDIAVITGLRAEVDEMIARDATFTADELKPLTDAETALAALTEQSEAAHAAVAALPEAADVLYTDKDAVADAAAQVAALEGKDTFTAEETAKLEAVQAVITAIEEDIADVEARIEALPASVTVSNAADVDAIGDALEALKAQGVAETDISNYDTYVTAKQQLTDVLAEIGAVEDLIAALPEATDIGYGDEDAIVNAEAELEALLAKYTDDAESINEMVDAAKLEAVRTALDELLTAKADLIEKIEAAELNVSLAAADQQAIADLRAEVAAMEEKGAEFTAEELANLTNAEAALADLQAQSKEAHDAIAALPAAADVKYTDKAAIEAAAGQMADMVAFGDTFTAEETGKLEAAQAEITEIEQNIDAVESLIAELEGITEDTATADDITAVQDARLDLEALFARGVTPDDVSNYETYTAAYAAVQSWLDLVDEVKALADALPQEITFNDEQTVQAAEEAYAKLVAQDLAELADAEAVKKITDARAALDALTDERTALVDKIADAELDITLSQADRDAITALRAEVTAMEEKGATFTADELAVLTKAETDMAALVARSEAAHAAVAELPARDEVLYTESDKLAEVEKEMNALKELGDTFTTEETNKLTEAKAGIADLEAAVETLAGEMADLKDPTDAETPIQYADKAALEALEEEVANLEARACDVDAMIVKLAAENEVYTGALARYAAYGVAVEAMETELAELNAKMAEAVKAWTYNDLAAYNAIAEAMNAAAEKYGIAEQQLEEVYPDYATIPAKNAEVKAVLDDVADKAEALPATDDLTLDDAAKLEEIEALLASLKADYGFTDEMLADNLGNALTTYEAAADRLEELGRPTPTPVPTPAPTAQPAGGDAHPDIADAIADGTWGQAPTPTPAPATVPQTGDSMNLQVVVALLALSVCGMAACVVALRKKNR